MTKQKSAVKITESPTRKLGPFPPPPTPPPADDTPLEAIFTKEPAIMKALHRRDYYTVGDVRKATNQELLSIYGILTTRLKKIRGLTGGI